MARSSWRRWRGGESDAAGVVAPRPDSDQPDDEGNALLASLNSLLGDRAGDAFAGDPTERYAAWAERLRAKRENATQTFAPGSGHDRQAPSYWDPAHVYRESARLEEELVVTSPRTIDIRAAYTALGLDVGASPEQVDATYRRLAKLHHPDRHRHEPEDVQAFHAERFRTVCNARKLLQQIL